MQKISFFIYNKEKFSVVIKKGEKFTKEKIFSYQEGDKMLNYFLENGAKLQERKGRLYLFGGNCFYYGFGGKVEILTSKGIVKILLLANCEYLFYANSGFIEGVELENITPIYNAMGIKGVKNASDMALVWEYLNNQVISNERITRLVRDSLLLIEKNSDSCDKCFSLDMSRLSHNLKSICDWENNEEKYKNVKNVVSKFLARLKNNTDERKNVRYYMVLQTVEGRLLTKQKNLYSLFSGKNKREIFEQFYDKQICTAIFWVVNGRKIVFPVWYLKKPFLEKDSGRLDCILSHYDFWRRLEKEYPNTDFATFPRGRIIFDLDKKENVVFYDECITKEQLKTILDLLQIKEYKVEYDEHYSCDKCVDKKGLF